MIATTFSEQLPDAYDGTDAETISEVDQGDHIMVDGRKHRVTNTDFIDGEVGGEPTVTVVPVDIERSSNRWDDMKLLRPWLEAWPKDRVGAVVEYDDPATVYDISAGGE